MTITIDASAVLAVLLNEHHKEPIVEITRGHYLQAPNSLDAEDGCREFRLNIIRGVLMNAYTYSQARQQLAALLDETRQAGLVQIKRRDGQTFVIKPVEEKTSPVDIDGVSTDLTLDELNEAVRESSEWI